jgi:hypothetical protein
LNEEEINLINRSGLIPDFLSKPHQFLYEMSVLILFLFFFKAGWNLFNGHSASPFDPILVRVLLFIDVHRKALR